MHGPLWALRYPFANDGTKEHFPIPSHKVGILSWGEGKIQIAIKFVVTKILKKVINLHYFAIYTWYGHLCLLHLLQAATQGTNKMNRPGGRNLFTLLDERCCFTDSKSWYCLNKLYMIPWNFCETQLCKYKMCLWMPFSKHTQVQIILSQLP